MKKNSEEDFLDELANNTPNSSQFDYIKEKNMKEVEEDLLGGKSFRKLKDEIKRGKK